MDDDLEDDGPPKKQAHAPLPEYAKFDTTIGDEFNPCCKVLETTGTVFAVSDIGKRATEHICKTLRKEGFSADWHSVKNSVSLKTLEKGDRLVTLKKRWRALVREYASEAIKIR